MKYGYHSALLADGTTIEGPLVVVTDEHDEIVSIEPLEKEHPFILWKGGTFIAVENNIKI